MAARNGVTVEKSFPLVQQSFGQEEGYTMPYFASTSVHLNKTLSNRTQCF
jgi:hypothetical protein